MSTTETPKKLRSSIRYGELRTPLEKKIDAEIVDRVEAGLAALKERYGDDWIDKIDPVRLDLSHGSRCVLGQVYGDYGMGQQALGIDETGARDFGFQQGKGVTYRMLDSVWKDVIPKLKTRIRAQG
jgi:hypothetical protein